MMHEGLLKTKLFAPPPRPNQVRRTLLLEKFTLALRRGVQCFLVSAPAGFGKTTLVVDCARAIGKPFVWLALDDGDNDVLRFWRYIDAALSSIDSRIGERLRPALYAAQAPAIEQIITGLVNDIISQEKEFLLVLDDYHVIELPAIHESLNYLLDHLPPQMNLMVITRSDPPLNLARRRGRGQMVELRANDLRFSPDETATFLNQTMQLGLTETDIASLSQRTEGWIAGLQMAAIALQGANSMQDAMDAHAFVTAFSGDDHHIADYLVEEVLQRQPEEILSFLVKTSILSRFSAPLCNAVTGRPDSAAILSSLERANLFLLPLDSRREWFRYHHLFAELLRQRLRETHSADAVAGLHRAAMNWLESQGDIPAAIRHARAIPDELAFLRLLEQNVGMLFATGELPQLFELASLLPMELRKESPTLCVLVAWAGLATSRFTEVPGWIKSVEAHFGIPAESALHDPALDSPRRAALLELLVMGLQLPPTRSPAEQMRHILAIREQINALPSTQICLLNPVENLKPVILFNLGQLAESTGDLDLAEQTLAETIRRCRVVHNSNLFYLTSAHLSSIQITRGKLQAALGTLAQALAEPTNPGEPLSPFIALIHAGLGEIQFEWNNLDAASQHFREGLNHARLWNLWDALLPLTFGQAWLMQREGETQAAAEMLNKLDANPLPARATIARAYAALLRGPDAAAAWLSAHPTECSREPDPENEFLLLTIARLLASARRIEESLALLQRMIRFAEDGQRTHMLIQAKVCMAVTAGQPDALLAALALAEPAGYFSTFLMEGEALTPLLQHVLRLPELGPRIQAYGRRILSVLDTTPRKPAQPGELLEPLTERELEVLRYIAQGLSNPEIASRLYLSTNTLKAHTQNIFSKLDVHNRMQAAARAKELGLIA